MSAWKPTAIFSTAALVCVLGHEVERAVDATDHAIHETEAALNWSP